MIPRARFRSCLAPDTLSGAFGDDRLFAVLQFCDHNHWALIQLHRQRVSVALQSFAMLPAQAAYVGFPIANIAYFSHTQHIMIPERYLDELRFHAENSLKRKDRLVELDARALIQLVNEVEQFRVACLIIEGRPLVPRTAA
jgi:hypothetical protein